MKIKTRFGEVVGQVLTSHTLNIYEACEQAGIDPDDYGFDELVMDYDDEDEYKPAVIASIQVEGQDFRGNIVAELDDTDYFGKTVQAYSIRIMLPDGVIEDSELPPQRTMDDVKEVIKSTWGQGFDLQWVSH